uniref:I/LWEQ domain-containing protein n=1 Tax=Astatotilapia calliptera TaxID=8154 RepID=A0AAX7U685_ASTCA
FLLCSINKAINTQEVAVKEKHARNILTLCKGAHTFWAAVNRLPLSSNAVLCWKFCHVFHKLLRDGHPNVRKHENFGHLSEGYGKLCSIYLKLLITKMEFHIKVSCSLDMSRSVSVTAAGQCRLAPLIQVILDCSHLYDYTVKLLFKLHSCLPADTLQGHRDRFQEQFKNLFYRSSNLQYFKRLIQIPQLPENPPNFLRASALSEHISPVVVIPAESSSPESEHVVETDDLVDTDVPVLFIFICDVNDRDRLIEQLTREIQALKEELESFRLEVKTAALRGRVNELEAELAEQSHLRLQAVGESEFLKAELDDLRRVREDTEKEQRSLTEIESKALFILHRHIIYSVNESNFWSWSSDIAASPAVCVSLCMCSRDFYQEKLRPTNEVGFFCVCVWVFIVRSELFLIPTAVNYPDHPNRFLLLFFSLHCFCFVIPPCFISSTQSSEVLGTQLAALESEKAELVQSLSKVEAELAARGEELERVQSSLVTERESRVKSAETLQNQLNEKESREQALESQLAAARWASLQGAVEEAEKIIQDSLAQIDDPAHISCTSSADYLASRCQASLECMERLNSTRVAFLADNTGVSELVRAVTQSGHLVGDTIVQGSATSHMVPVEQADALSESVKVCGAEALALLGLMKQQDGLAAADSGKLKAALEAVLATAEKLRPQGLELQQGELGDLVEQEMAATSAAVESAAARIEEMLNNSRAVDTGIKMEVNERILASCTELMQAIKELILSSKDLQRDIVESGRGAASMKEFYAKNSRWTEGLISASKAVGWGATVMVDAADLVVQGKGKFEELMVCSHEIAASTAQLVAASKVKADKDSTKLHRLQQASRGVTQATAAVVASTKSGKSQIEETDTMDFSSMTLTQIKRQEMDAQVLVLELETRLQKERERLGELRKKHYELAGVAEGWGEDEEGGHLRYNLCTVLKKP